MHCDQKLGEEIRHKIGRLKWSLWHGNLYKARYKIEDIESLIYNFEETYLKFKPLLKAVEEFRTYIMNNAHLIPNYGERYRNGEAIATGFVESTVGLDHGIGHFRLVEADSKARAAAPPMPKSSQTSSAASARKTAPPPSCRQAG